MSKPILTRDWGRGPIRIDGPAVEMKPTEIHLHHKADGDLDGNPSFAIVLIPLRGEKIYAQVSLRILSEALAELGYTLHKP